VAFYLQDQWLGLIGKRPLMASSQGGVVAALAVPKAWEAIWNARTPPAYGSMCGAGSATFLASAGHDARAIQDWLGHRNIQHTVRHTELSPDAVQELLARLSVSRSVRGTVYLLKI
jgi:integrase